MFFFLTILEKLNYFSSCGGVEATWQHLPNKSSTVAPHLNNHKRKHRTGFSLCGYLVTKCIEGKGGWRNGCWREEWVKKMDVKLEVNQSGVSATFHICFQFLSSFLPLSDLYLLFVWPSFLKKTRKFLFLSSITKVSLSSISAWFFC